MHPPLRPATPHDIDLVCASLRPADRDECLAATGLPPEAVLPAYAHRSLAMCVPATGEVVGLCGVGESPVPGFGTIWMCATTAISRHRLELLRHARQWIDHLLTSYERVGNMVDNRNKLHVRWLQMLGFRFTGIAIVGPESIPFIIFERTR